MGYEPPVIDQSTTPPPGAPPGSTSEWERREVHRGEMVRTVLATVVAICGGLAAIFLFFAAMGAVDLGDAVAATIIAIVMGLIWFAAFYHRQRTNAGRVQWRDRERRGF